MYTPDIYGAAFLCNRKFRQRAEDMQVLPKIICEANFLVLYEYCTSLR